MSTLIYNRLRLRGDDRGMAMMSVIMLIMVLSMLAMMILGMVLMQSGPTLMQDKNVRTLAAAQAGLDAAAFQIRNAYLGGTAETPMGDIRRLPCQVSGLVDDMPDSPHYEADIRYYKDDPEGMDSDWLDDNEVECVMATGSGGGVHEVVRYALISSEGFDPAASATADRADRTLEANYTFQLTTRKVAGGRIWDDNNEYCWVADAPTAGQQVRYRKASDGFCDEPTDVNSWIWANDYMIHLASTEAPGVIPLCISGRHTGSTPQPMRLQECTTTSQDPLGQRFAWTGDHTWRGQDAANSPAIYPSYIIKAGSGPVYDGMPVSVGSSQGWKSVNPDAAVGKGNASYDTNQVVNHLLFGRCLDVTDEQITSTYLITYPCKQDPSGGDSFSWNHKWYYDEPAAGQEYVDTKITVYTNSRTYCLITTDSTTHVREAGTNHDKHERFPRFIYGTNQNNSDCSSSTTDWKRYGYNDDEALAYHIMDSNGRCLSAAGPRTTGHSMWNSVIVEDCADKESQKWNVPTDPVEAALSGFEETTGRTG